jgi:serine/threonine protein kinase
VNPDRWREVNALFHDALAVPASERADFLSQAESRDPELTAEVRSLLSRHESSRGFLEQPAWAVAADLILDPNDLDRGSMVGRQLGAYRILREVGRGGMGVVYAARDERLGRTVALKALPPEYTSDRRHRDRLAREARAAATFTHEAIATVYALEEIDGELFIASELVDGETLRAELGHGPTPVDRLLPTLIAIASGLAAAHAHNVVHRDLKPENIIRRTDGQIKILDFGLARVSDPEQSTVTRLTEPGMTPGTPGYMAPEQVSGAEADARTDIFAFGVLAWELATGEHPFGSNPTLMLARMMEGRTATLGRQLPIPALEPIIRCCLKVSPGDRYPSADALLDDLRRLATGSGTRRLTAAILPGDEGLWWWQFHQRTVTAVDAVAPVLVGIGGTGLTRQAGTWLFFAALALATAAVTLRLNLLFTARVHPAMLAEHRAKLVRWIASSEVALCVLMAGTAVAVIESHSIIAGVLICVAIVTLASLALIEPATTGGAGLAPPKAP